MVDLASYHPRARQRHEFTIRTFYGVGPWPMARRLPGSTSTCSASMTSRTRSCETASEFDPKNRWTKWGAIFG
jgi:hypothetical protein